jgi:2-aminoethylphosphonate-pyruvate transaminase
MAEREWILLNPGPANTSASVREALVMPDLCHREPECFEMMRRCREAIVRLAGGGADWTSVLFTGSGTAAVEATICAAVPAGGTLLVVDNGVYGDRMLKIAGAHGIATVAVRGDIFTPVRPADVEVALVAHPEASHIAVVHHETTTGLLNPVAELARVAERHGRRLVVDAMSSLFGESLDLGQPAIDFVTASANKCLQGIPGVSFVPGPSISISTVTSPARSATTRRSPRPCRSCTPWSRRSRSWPRKGSSVASRAMRTTRGCCARGWRASASRRSGRRRAAPTS